VPFKSIASKALNMVKINNKEIGNLAKPRKLMKVASLQGINSVVVIFCEGLLHHATGVSILKKYA